MSEILNRVVAIGEEREREMLKDASTFVYRQRPQGEVQAHVFFPEKPSGKRRPAMVFFHGGFWDTPAPAQFVPHCLHFAHRGVVAIAAETRCASRHGTGALEAIDDARDLIRWLRHNAKSFEIDPDRIIVCGSGGGGLLALLTTLPDAASLPAVDGLDCHAQALVLFSTQIDTEGVDAVRARFPDAPAARKNNPLRLVRRKLPPMIFFHSKADRIAPFAKVASFCRKMRWRGNSCELIDFEKADHGFFNFNVDHHSFELTINAADRFLVEQGLLEVDEDAEKDF